MKKIIPFFLSILVLGLLSCDKGDDIQSYTWVPAIVGFDSDLTQQPTLLTPYGTFVAPELQGAFLNYLDKGDALLTNYSINYDQQPSDKYTVLGDLSWIKVNLEPLRATDKGESVTGDFDAPILSVEPYVRLGGILFIFFNHSAPLDQPFLYEMTYDYNEISEIPTVYFRAKETEPDESSSIVYPNAAAFDLSAFLLTHKDSENKVEINIKYKTGEEDGEDIYEEFLNNPVKFDLNK